ncbi:alpha/beta-hydrolase [Dacryopinax primogenitus]|uniref:Alpha/beta-hydrolase n=1 Tax=Dacryopinax primogenitus (strain DJM 731) TaxID=1858805 RepID=M5G8I8_DACPD|nr:alpha/beta-hydrolase [Dacryopinax primogenitus]EJU02162.1 alpha/beta-hydrolase [Dacryopinax primogenitus]
MAFEPAFANLESVTGEEPIRLRYYDSQPGRKDGVYTTVIVVHGNGYNGAIWKPWAPTLPTDVRLIAYCRRGYQDSSPIYNPPEPVPGQVAGRGIVDVMGMVKHCVEVLGVPAFDEATGKGGIALMGWSRGCVLMVGLMDLYPTLPSTGSKFGLPSSLPTLTPSIKSHLRTVLHYEPPLQAVGIPPGELPAMKVPVSEQGRVFGQWMKNTVPEHARPVLDEAFQAENVPVDTAMILVGQGDWSAAAEIAKKALNPIPEGLHVGLLYGTKSLDYVYDAVDAYKQLLWNQPRTGSLSMEGTGHFAMASHPELLTKTVVELLDTL